MPTAGVAEAFRSDAGEPISANRNATPAAAAATIRNEYHFHFIVVDQFATTKPATQHHY